MQRPTTHAPRAGCSLCTIITTLQNTGSSSNQSTLVDVDHAYRTPWNPNLSPNMSSPTVQGGSRFPNSPTAHVPLTVPSSASGSSASNSADGRRAVYMDEDLSVWAADRSTGEALASGERHLVLAFNAHVESVYEFGRADVPLLVRTLRIANDLLDKDSSGHQGSRTGEKKIGFVVGPIRDPKHPYAHVHLHAVKGKWDLASYYRKTLVYNFMGWYELEDLIAEIREGSSNNRVKSGYEHHAAQSAPSPSLPSGRLPEPSLHTPTIPSNVDYLAPPTQTSRKGKQRETLPDAGDIDRHLKDQAVKDIDLLIERVKWDQAASEDEWRAARPKMDDKAAMV